MPLQLVNTPGRNVEPHHSAIVWEERGLLQNSVARQLDARVRAVGIMIAQPRQADAILVLGDILSEDHTFTISLAEELFFEPPFAPPVARVATVAGIDLPGLDFDF